MGFYGLSWFVWAAITLALALLYGFVWPKRRAEGRTGLHFFILRWGHPLVWSLVTINFVLRGLNATLGGIANILALAGFAVYLLFIGVMLSTK